MTAGLWDRGNGKLMFAKDYGGTNRLTLDVQCFGVANRKITDFDQADMRAQVDFRSELTATNTGWGIMLRMNDTTGVGYYCGFLRNNGGINQQPIIQNRSGTLASPVFATLASGVAVPLPINTNYRLIAIVEGTSPTLINMIVQNLDTGKTLAVLGYSDGADLYSGVTPSTTGVNREQSGTLNEDQWLLRNFQANNP